MKIVSFERLEERAEMSICRALTYLTVFYAFGILTVRFIRERGYSLLAQLVEHYLDKVGVSSSSLLETTIYNISIRCFRRTLLFL